MIAVQWTEFDYADRDGTRPPETWTLYWIMEAQEGGVEVGYFDGYTWHLWGGADDCKVTHWAPIEYPEAPPQ